MLKGDFGYSFEFNLPVSQVIGDRLMLSMILSFATVVFTWVVAFPIGVYSATHRYSFGDHSLTLLGFLLGYPIPLFCVQRLDLFFQAPAGLAIQLVEVIAPLPVGSRPHLGARMQRPLNTVA